MLEFLTELSAEMVYAVLAAGAVSENVLPVLPADTFIVAGGFLAGLGSVGIVPVFTIVWLFNVGGAVAVYLLGRRYGRGFFLGRAGARLVSPDGMRRMEQFYGRWGVAAIFVARFLPGFRALVPVFAGVANLRAIRAVPPLIVASAIWYGGLVRLGYLAGDNLDAVAEILTRTNRGLLAASIVVAAALLVGWRRYVQHRADDDG